MRAFRFAYDGRPFYGFQRQPDVPTVEDAILDALCELDVAPAGGTPPGYSAAGRTDRGVSALAQTVAFECPAWCSPGALNGALPASVRAWAAADVPADFHATHDAVRREYTYHLYAPRAGASADAGRPAASEWGDDAPRGDDDRDGTTAPGVEPFGAVRRSVAPVDDDRVRLLLDRLSGEHDFHNLTPDDRGTVRDLTLDATRDGDVLVLRVAAGGFARQLVRRLVTLVRAVGTGDRALDFVDRVLAPAPLDGSDGIGPAAPEPLVLTAVDYPAGRFEVDADAAAATRAIFAGRAREAAVVARVSGAIADGVGAGRDRDGEGSAGGGRDDRGASQ